MKYALTYLLTLISAMGFSQTLNGYYNLSQFEMPAHLYLLDNGQFHYSAIFGSVDLEIYGKYAIEDTQLVLQPKEEQMQPFILYTRENKSIQDSISFYYYSPDENQQFQIIFLADKDWVRSLNPPENNGVRFKIKKEKIDSLSIGYPAILEESNIFHIRNTYLANIPPNQNEILIFYNRYYKMRKQFFKSPLQLKGNNIVVEDQLRTQEPISPEEKEKIIGFLKVHEMFESSTIYKEQVYSRVLLTTGKTQPKVMLENGLLKEIEH